MPSGGDEVHSTSSCYLSVVCLQAGEKEKAVTFEMRLLDDMAAGLVGAWWESVKGAELGVWWHEVLVLLLQTELELELELWRGSILSTVRKQWQWWGVSGRRHPGMLSFSLHNLTPQHHQRH